MAKKKKNKSKKNSALDTSALKSLLDLLESGDESGAKELGARLGLGQDEIQKAFSSASQMLKSGPDPRKIAEFPVPFQIAFVLFAEKDDDDELIVDLLQFSTEKAVKKEAKRALHKMRSRGMDVSIPSSGGSILDRMVQEEQKPLTCQISPVASDGTMILLLAKYSRGGVGFYQAVINDEDGLMDFQGGIIGRKQYRRLEQTIPDDERDKLLDVSYEKVRSLLSKAADQTRAKGKQLPEQYLDASSDLGPISDAQAEDEVPDELKGGQDYEQFLAKAESLFELDEFEEWIPPEDIMKFISKKLDEVEQSDLIVSEEQRRDQIERAFELGAKEMLQDEEQRKKWHQRLMTNARFLWEKDRKLDAQTAAAVAWQLLEEGFEPKSSQFFNKMVKKLFPPIDQIEERMTGNPEDSEGQDDEESSGNIILPP